MLSTKIALINLIGKSQPENRGIIIQSSALIALASNCLFFSLILYFSKPIAILLLKSPDSQNMIIFLAILGPLFSAKEFLESVYQAQKIFKIIARAQSIGLGLALVAVFPLAYFYGIEGILADLIIWYFVSIVIYLPGALKYFELSNFRWRNIIPVFGQVFKICLLNVLRDLALALSLLVFRIVVVQLLDLVQTGYFQAIWSISNYAIILLAGFAVYYFPMINSFNPSEKLQLIINENFELFLYLCAPLFAILVSFPELFLYLLYTGDYVFLASDLAVLLIGKFVEIFYMLMILILVSQDRFKKYMGLEISKTIMQVILPYLLILNIGFQGAVWGLVITNIVTLILVFLSLRDEQFLKINRNNTLLLLKIIAGLAILALLPYGNLTYSIIRAVLAVALLLVVLEIGKYRGFIEDLLNRFGMKK